MSDLLPKLDTSHIPSLKSKDDSRFPMTQSICIELLSQGHVRSFIDFFYMVLGHNKLDISYTPESLQEFKLLLTQVEDSSRQDGQSISIYESRKNIAKYFQSLKQFDVAISYFQDALDICVKVIKQATFEMESTLNLGKAYEEYGKFKIALEFYERSHAVANRVNNIPGGEVSSKAIINIHMLIAEQFELNGDYEKAILHYIECITILNREGNSQPNLNNLIGFKLGKAYKEIGDTTTAIKYQEAFMKLSNEANDKRNEGLATFALASCYEQAGNIELSVKFLKTFVEMVQSDPEQRLDEAAACNQLGMLYNKMKMYSEAVKYLERHFNIISAISKENSSTLLKSNGIKQEKLFQDGNAAIQLGIARGKSQMGKFFDFMTDPYKMSELIKWKNSRDFSNLNES